MDDDDDDPTGTLLGDASAAVGVPVMSMGLMALSALAVVIRRSGSTLVNRVRHMSTIQLVAPPIIIALLLLDQSSKSSFVALAMFLVLKSAWLLDTVRSAMHPTRLLVHVPMNHSNGMHNMPPPRTIDERIEQSFRAIVTVMLVVVATTFTLTLLIISSHNHTIVSPHLPLLTSSTLRLITSTPSADTWIILSVTLLPLLLAAADPWVGHLWALPSNQRTPATLAEAIRRIDFGQLVGRVRLHVVCDRDHTAAKGDAPQGPRFQVTLIPVQVREMVPMVWSPLSACPNKSGAGHRHLHGLGVHIAGSEASCAICLTNYAHGDPVWRFNCGHHFHSHCVVKWISMVSSCPLCRMAIEDMDVDAK